MQHILTDLTEVDVEVTSVIGGRTFLAGVDEGIEQPEFDILNVCLLEVVGVEFAHHTTPLRLWLAQCSVGIKVVRQVIGTSFLGVIGQVQDRQRRGGTVIGALLTVGIELLHIDLSHIVVGQLLQIALDMRRGQCGGPTGKERVDVIPGKEGTVVATRHICLVLRLPEGGRHAGEAPRFRVTHVDVILRVLKIVDIRGIVLDTTSCTCDEVSKLSREVDVRRFLDMQEGNLVKHRGKPLALLFPVHIQAPQRVVQRFSPHRDLRGECLFGEVHQRTTDLEVLREFILPVDTNHRLTLHTIVGIRLQRHIHIRPCIDDTLVQNGHLTCRVIHGIIRALGEYHATCRHHHRALWHVIGA